MNPPEGIYVDRGAKRSQTTIADIICRASSDRVAVLKRIPTGRIILESTSPGGEVLDLIRPLAELGVDVSVWCRGCKGTHDIDLRALQEAARSFRRVALVI